MNWPRLNLMAPGYLIFLGAVLPFRAAMVLVGLIALIIIARAILDRRPRQPAKVALLTRDEYYNRF